MAIAANTRVRPENMRAWMKPTSNSNPYTPTVATKGTKKADTKTSISPAVMFPNNLKVKLISLTNSLNASKGPTKKKSRRPWKASRNWNRNSAAIPCFKLATRTNFVM